MDARSGGFQRHCYRDGRAQWGILVDKRRCWNNALRALREAAATGLPEARDTILSSAQRLAFWRPSSSEHMSLMFPPTALLYSRVAHQLPFSTFDVSTAL